MTDVSESLRKAADYIGEHGWCQRELRNYNTGSVCAMGAIREVHSEECTWLDQEWQDTASALHAYLEDQGVAKPLFLGVLHPVAEWNDAPERTAEDVILTFKRAAEAWED